MEKQTTICGGIMRKKVTLRNNFHNTTSTVFAVDSVISSSSLKRARKKLCGMGDCLCGDIRGPQDKIIDICYSYSAGEFAQVSEK